MVASSMTTDRRGRRESRHKLIFDAPGHQIVEIRSPVAIILQCSCGWRHTETRRQNALARVAKIRAQGGHRMTTIKRGQIWQQTSRTRYVRVLYAPDLNLGENRVEYSKGFQPYLDVP